MNTKLIEDFWKKILEVRRKTAEKQEEIGEQQQVALDWYYGLIEEVLWRRQELLGDDYQTVIIAQRTPEIHELYQMDLELGSMLDGGGYSPKEFEKAVVARNEFARDIGEPAYQIFTGVREPVGRKKYVYRFMYESGTIETYYSDNFLDALDIAGGSDNKYKYLVSFDRQETIWHQKRGLKC